MPSDAGRPVEAGGALPPALGDLERAGGIVEPRRDSLRGARVFVTGGTGFVGKWLLASALHADDRWNLGLSITVLTRDPGSFDRQVPFLTRSPAVRLVAGDVRTFDLTPDRYTHLIHAATDAVVGADPLETFDTCVRGTRRVLEFAEACGVARALLVSSGAVYGRQPADLAAIPEDFGGAPESLNPACAYAEGKRAAEWLGAAFAARSSMTVSLARCFALAGPFLPMDRHFALGNFLRDAIEGRKIVLHGDGTACRSYLHGAELAGWLWTLLLEGRSGVAYNVGGEEVVSMAGLAGEVARAVDSLAGIEVRGIPAPGLAPNLYVPDVTRARHEFDLPAPWSLAETVGRHVAWLKAARSAQPRSDAR